ncbi:helicase-related protein [Sphingomonas sp. TDK1]|uniref:helicase-related protein n=1 Tax=Sphingomonas sp. TDK1 TaxID=453247 RepID=UPI0007D9F214|nr:helicase-related protein [Sphingomonas sp. TDK1]OAN62172.1 DEAD/DEAH box helicase [Sphingomonas sp. TDK1]
MRSASNPVPAETARQAPPPRISVGTIAALLADTLANQDLLYAAGDEARALAVTHALAALVPEATVLFCPGSDALPGDAAPASPANVGARVATLRRLLIEQARRDRPWIACITTGEALGRRYPPPEAFDAAPPRVAVGEAIALPTLFEALIDAGYIEDERVDEPGEVALRGQVLDVYPADAEAPRRIEVADGRVIALRSYDPATQRTIDDCDAQELGRVAEPPVEGDGVPLIAHVPDAVLAIEPAAAERRERFLALAADSQRRRPGRAIKDVVEERQWRAAMQARAMLDLSAEDSPPARFVERRAPLRAFARAARAAMEAGDQVVLIGSARDLRFLRPRVARVLSTQPIDLERWADLRTQDPGSLCLLAAPIERGFRHGRVLAVAAADLLGSRAERESASAISADAAIFGQVELRIGDLVVHEDHGIASVAGLAPMPGDGSTGGDAIALTYADAGVRLVPVAEADRLWRYGGDADAVALDKLDGSSWQRRRTAIDRAIAETARGMIALAEARLTQAAPILAPEPAAYERFAAGFPFSETRDQARAIEAVRTDLGAGLPMDRLVIGDVGFGKTEVALRAAAIAALAGHQVAVAAPTTVLARQHLETFTERFEAMGITVAGLSRLSTPAERKQVKAGLADGSIQIVIGTGAVAGKGVTYAQLGLVIIDEEQRFGTADKAKLRDLGAGHVLTLSATPIPRTLQAALVGVQHLSVLATPPARRQPIRTALGHFDEVLVRAALLRERSRGGQSFIVVPRIEDMAFLTAKIARLVPELTLLQAHGKMPAAEIDDAMVRFGRGEGDILLATSIIEAGLDVPRANTMVLYRADRFGLSQLHQLRGRVGRGSRRGQVLLLTDPEKPIAARTLKRLRTLEAFDRLGAGFAISAQDLDMRGAGDLLGEAQAGHMKLIGIDLYQHLLEAALRTARGEAVERWAPELHLGVEGALPECWIPDEETRVGLYVRIGRAADGVAIDAIEAELEDRFGTLPAATTTLLAVTRIRARARMLDVARIDAGPAGIALTPRPTFEGNAAAAGLIQKGERLLLAERIEDPLERLARVETILDAMTQDG